jgi:hypothetical protein
LPDLRDLCRIDDASASHCSPLSAAREPAGTPSLYLPVSSPNASGPGRQPEADVLVEAGVLADAIAMKKVALRLLHDRFGQMMPLGDLPRRHDLGGAPFRCAPVVRLACADMSCIAHTVSSTGVSGSGRWQKTRST